MKEKVLFICTHNSARSQIGEAILSEIAGDKFETFSAGTEPTEINQYAIKVMAEVGLDISKNRTKSVNEFIELKFDYVITVCDSAKETCPFFPGAKILIHKSFPDPAEFTGSEDEILSKMRQVRDEIRAWLEIIFTQ